MHTRKKKKNLYLAGQLSRSGFQGSKRELRGVFWKIEEKDL